MESDRVHSLSAAAPQGDGGPLSHGRLLADLAAATTVAEIENVQERILAAELAAMLAADAAELDRFLAEMEVTA